MMRSIGFSLGLTAFGLALTACSTPQLNYAPEVRQFSRPPVGSTSTATIGDELVSQGSTASQEGLNLSSAVHSSWAYALGPGYYPKIGNNDRQNFYSFASGYSPAPGYGILTKNPFADPPQAIRADKDGSHICVVTIFNVAVCNNNVAGEITKHSLSSDNAFQQTLIYNGRVGDKINIGYREFYGSIARPAFNNNVEYDLSISDTIAYRGVKLIVIKADNTSITYKLISNFNTTHEP